MGFIRDGKNFYRLCPNCEVKFYSTKIKEIQFKTGSSVQRVLGGKTSLDIKIELEKWNNSKLE